MSADQKDNEVNEEVLEAIPVAAQEISGRLDTLEETSADTLQVSRADLDEKKKETRLSKVKERVKDRLATKGEELGEKALEGTEEAGKTAVKTGVRVLAEGLLGPLAPIVDVGAELIGHDVGDLVMGGFGKFFKKKEETADKDDESADKDDKSAENLDFSSQNIESSSQNLNKATEEFKEGYKHILSGATPGQFNQDGDYTVSKDVSEGFQQANKDVTELAGPDATDVQIEEARNKLLDDSNRLEESDSERDTEHQEDMLLETMKMRDAIEKGGVGGGSGGSGGLLSALGGAAVFAKTLAVGAAGLVKSATVGAIGLAKTAGATALSGLTTLGSGVGATGAAAAATGAAAVAVTAAALYTLGDSIYTTIELRKRDNEALADQTNIAKMKNKLSEDEAKQVGMSAQDIAAGTSGSNLITRRVLEQQGDLSSEQLGAKKEVAQREMNDLQGQISLLESQQEAFVDSGAWGQLGATLAGERFSSEDEEKLNRLKEQEVQQRGTLSSIDDAVYVAKEREKKGTESAVDTMPTPEESTTNKLEEDTPIGKALDPAEEVGLTSTSTIQSKEIQKVVPIQPEAPTPEIDNGLKEVASAVTDVGNGLKETTAKMLALASAKPPVPIHAGLNNQIDMISDGPTVLAASGMLS